MGTYLQDLGMEISLEASKIKEFGRNEIRRMKFRLAEASAPPETGILPSISCCFPASVPLRETPNGKLPKRKTECSPFRTSTGLAAIDGG